MNEIMKTFFQFLAFLVEMGVVCSFLYLKFTGEINASYWWILVPMIITWFYFNPEGSLVSI